MLQEEDFKATDLEREAEWYFASESGQNKGPYMVTEIRAFYESGEINESTFVWNTLWNHSDWIPIKLIKHLYPKTFIPKSENKNKIDEQVLIPVLAEVDKDAGAVLPIVEKEILNEGEEKVVVTSTREKEIVGYNGLSTMTNNNQAASADIISCSPVLKVPKNLEFESTSNLAAVGSVQAVGTLEVSGSQHLTSTEKDLDKNEQLQVDAAFSLDKLDSVMDQLKAFEFEMEQYKNELKNMDMVISNSSISAISGEQQSPIIDGNNNTDKVGLEGSDLPTQEIENPLASAAAQKKTRVKKELSPTIEFSEENNSSVYHPKTESHVMPSASSERQIQDKESPQHHLMEDLSSDVKKSAAESSLPESFSIFLSSDQLHKVDNITQKFSILQLRKIAGQRENVPANLVMLLYRDIVLDNDMSLKDYNIGSGGTVVVKFNEPVINNGKALDNESSKPTRDETPPPYCPEFDEFDPGIVIDSESNKSENLKMWKSKSPNPPESSKAEKPLTPRRKVSPSSPSFSDRLVVHKPLPALSESIEGMASKPLPVFPSSLGAAASDFSNPKSLSEVKSEDDLALEAYPESQRESITALENWGFPRDSVIVALELTKFSKEHAVDWLLSKEYNEHKRLDNRIPKKSVEESKERVVQPEAKPKKRQQDWNCPACTLLNSNAVQCCTLCGTSKFGNRQQPAALELDYRKPQDDELEIPAENLSHAEGSMPIAPVKKREKKIYGNYQVRILKAVGIDQKANYCLLSLGKTTKKTKTLKKAKILYFNDVFYFTGVRADSSLQLRISLMAKRLRADKVVGQVSYAMPTFFNRECQDFLELINERNEPSANISISVLFKQGPSV